MTNLKICTLENYVEGAYRYFCIKNIRTIPDAESLFLILIDMLESMHVCDSSIYCTSIGDEIQCKDITVYDIYAILRNKRMEFFDEEEGKERFSAQQTLIADF